MQSILIISRLIKELADKTRAHPDLHFYGARPVRSGLELDWSINRDFNNNNSINRKGV
jgi:hypothetical protein